jgi:hypothetical protein
MSIKHIYFVNNIKYSLSDVSTLTKERKNWLFFEKILLNFCCQALKQDFF